MTDDIHGLEVHLTIALGFRFASLTGGDLPLPHVARIARGCREVENGAPAVGEGKEVAVSVWA